VALSSDERDTLNRLSGRIANRTSPDELLWRYYKGQQRMQHMGIALPPEMLVFETIVNWPRSYVDALRARMRMRSLFLPGEQAPSTALRETYEANNLDSESNLSHLDRFIYGRSFTMVGTNEEDPEHPLISVESPRQMAAEVDARRRRLKAVAKVYSADPTRPANNATLYLPDSTIWARRDGGRWVEENRDDHRLGRVPGVMGLNRRLSGDWAGESEMTDIIPLTDAACRTLTNAGFAMETHAVPQKWVLGMAKGDFVDAEGKPIPVWESYFGAIWANENADAKVGQFTASDMANFEKMVNLYAQQASGLTGLPMRYFGQNTANPPSADGIRADESRLIRSAEMQCTEAGDQWGWVFAIAERFRTGEWVDGARIKVDWFDPATPTVAAMSDSAVKIRQAGGSLRGMFSQMGWSDARIEQEMDWLAEEAVDQNVATIARTFQAGGAAPAPDVTNATPAPGN
jgi:hypothetical protein